MVGVPVFAQTKDFPLKGEGARAFLRRHNLEGENFYNEFIRLNDRKLGKNHTLLQGIKYTLPSKPEKTDTVETSAAVESESDTTVKKVEVKQETKKKSTGKKIHEPLFGKKEQDFEVIDNELAGATFFLSSGHGGPDCGAVAKVNGHELHEDEYAYDIVLRLAKNLMKHGATVHIIIQDKKDGIRDDLYLANSKRETCMGKEIPLNQKKRLKQRTDKINSLSAQASGQYKRALFVHLDSRSEKEQLDVFFYYQNGNTASLRLAETVRKTFRSKYEEHQPGRGFSGTVSTRPLAVLKNTNIVSLFVELANMQNVNDQKRYVLADNRQALANWLALGFIRDYKNSK
jgi:N-acetylmuramoyl-L-alanine amidase